MTWEALTPTSFQTTLYLPSLKISITAGSFITYRKGETGLLVGRVVEVVSSINLIPQDDNYPLIDEPLPDDFDDDILVQFAKVNLFKYRSLLSDRDFPAEDNFASSCTGWPKVVQVKECEWIPSYSIFGLAFIFMEDDIASHIFDDCRGMSNFFVLKYRLAQNGFVSVVPRNACPPFAGCIERCHKMWSVDHSQIIFNSIHQIVSRRAVAR
jgi:hypothetical protein